MPVGSTQTQLGAIALLQQTANVIPNLAGDQTRKLRSRERAQPSTGIVLAAKAGAPDVAAIVTKAAARNSSASSGQSKRAAMIEKIVAFARRARRKGRARPRKGFANSHNGDSQDEELSRKELGYVPTSVPVPSHLAQKRTPSASAPRERSLSLDSASHVADIGSSPSVSDGPDPDAPLLDFSPAAAPRVSARNWQAYQIPEDLGDDYELAERDVASFPSSASVFPLHLRGRSSNINAVAILPKVGPRADTAHRRVELPRGAAMTPRRNVPHTVQSASRDKSVVFEPTSAPSGAEQCHTGSSFTNSSKSCHSNEVDSSDCCRGTDGDSIQRKPRSSQDQAALPRSASLTDSPFLSSTSWDCSPPFPTRKSVHPSVFSSPVKAPRSVHNGTGEWVTCPTSPSAVTASEDCGESRASIAESTCSGSSSRRHSNERLESLSRGSESDSVDMAERIALAVVEISSDDGDVTEPANCESKDTGCTSGTLKDDSSGEEKEIDVGVDEFSELGAEKVHEIRASTNADPSALSASRLERSIAFPDIFVPQRRAKTSLEEAIFPKALDLKLTLPDLSVPFREERLSAVTPDSLAEDCLGTAHRTAQMTATNDDFISFMFDNGPGVRFPRSGPLSLVNFVARSQSQRIEKLSPTSHASDDIGVGTSFDRNFQRHSVHSSEEIDDSRKSSHVRRALARAMAIARLN